MAIVEDGAMMPRGADAGVSNMPTSTVGVHMVLEKASEDTFSLLKALKIYTKYGKMKVQ